MKFPQVDLTGLQFAKEMLEYAKIRLGESSYPVCYAIHDFSKSKSKESIELEELELINRISESLGIYGFVTSWALNEGIALETQEDKRLYRLAWVNHMLEQLE